MSAITALMNAILLLLVLSGTVRDAGGDALPGVTVFVKGAQETVVTDAEGRFAIDAAGPVTLVAFLGGFEPREVVAAPGEDLEIRLTLAPVSESITVTARADREAPMSTYEQRPLDIVRTPGAAGDVFRALQTLPGVVKADEGAGLFVRGGDVSETRVMLDGATISHPYRFESPSGGQFGSVEPFLLQGVSFSTGGFSARYGNILSGIVDLRGLGNPRADAYTATAGLAGLSGRGAHSGGETRGFRTSGNLRFPRLLFAVNGAPREFDRYPGGWDLNASAHYESPTLGRLKVFAMEQRSSVGVSIEQENFEGFLHADTRHDVLAASWKTVAYGWQLSSGLGASLYRNATTAGVTDIDNDDRRASWRLDLSRAVGRTIVRVGSDADYAQQSIRGTVPIRGGDLGGDSGTRSYDVAYRDQHAGVYGEVERTFGRWTATAGVRADHAQRAGSWLDPRLNVTYAIPSLGQLRFAWGIYRQSPGASYYDRADGIAGLEPMEARHLIAGFERGDPDQPLHLRVEAYDKQYTKLPLDDVRGFSSDGYGHARGVDTYVRRRWETFELRASYSFLQSRRRWTPYDQRRRFELPDGAWRTDFDIPHSAELVASMLVTPRLTIGSAFRIATGRPFTPILGARTTPTGFEPVYGGINSERMPRFQRLDLSTSYRTVRESGRSFVYFVSCTNVLARRNAFEYAYSNDFSERTPVVSATPRSFYAGISITR
jgi:vitamin B12 transporter